MPTPRIVIDPGHGGNQALGGSSPLGCRGPAGTLEKDVNLRLAERVAQHLGGNVVLTRTGDTSLSLADRAAVAQRLGADLFISLHANSGPQGTRGAETFVHTSADPRSAALGEALQRRLGRMGVPDRGLKTAQFGVLRPDRHAAHTAACLVEVDFLSDPGGERRLTNAQDIDALGRTLAEGVREHVAAASRNTYGTPLGLFERYRTFGRVVTSDPAARVVPDYSARSTSEAYELFVDWLNRSLRFTVGVDNTMFFPHSGICKLLTTWSDNRRSHGTGFYISANRLLTAGHMVRRPGGVYAVSMEVSPGSTDDRSTFPSFTLSGASNFVPHPSYAPGAASQYDFDMAVVRLSGADEQLPPTGEHFVMEELRLSPASGIIVCGYAAEDQNRNRQHLDVDEIRQLQTETFTYALQTREGTSGSPVFYMDGDTIKVVGVHCAGHDAHENKACRLTDSKIAWVRGI
ncbi:N-acetylmuramoyl-L-alanine amidase [Myxococcaceae bacterium GXIMD 01537]